MTPLGRNILGYILLPQILPRIQGLAQGGFGFIAYTMACVFQNAGLLPEQHPYCNPVNTGKFGVHHVLAQGASNLKFSLRHLDQILIFALMLIGTVLLLVQIALLGIMFFTQLAHASRMPTDPLTPLPTTFNGFFLPATPTDDIAYMLMDRMFGIPGMFGSCVDLDIPCLGDAFSDGSYAAYPYLSGLHDLFGLYSNGLLWVAALIFAYHIITMIAEMTETGTFFGRRFNRIWAPIRMVAAIGLLLPVPSPLTGDSGLNAAQYITLYIAKYGSGMASNAWALYMADITDPDTPLGGTQSLLSKPQYPSANDLVQFMAMAQTCWWAYDDLYGKTRNDIEAYAVREEGLAPTAIDLDTFMTTYTNLYDIQKWFNDGDIEIVFGEKNDTDSEYKKYKGNVKPLCGVLTIPTGRIVDGGGTFYDGIDKMTYDYLNELVNKPWYATTDPMNVFDIAQAVVQTTYNDFSTPLPSDDDLAVKVDAFNTKVKTIVDDAYTTMTTDPIPHDPWAATTDYGWAGAAIWYTKIAQVNGTFEDAALGTPKIAHYPAILERIMQQRQAAHLEVSGETKFTPDLSAKTPVRYENDRDQIIGTAMNTTYLLFNHMPEQVQEPSTGNTLVDGINALFKKSALWSFRNNQDIHPLAALVGLGKSLLINSVMTFGSGSAAGLMATLGKTAGIKQVAKILSSLIITIAYIGFASGVLLYYVVPFMPFIYFFFAVMGWARTIFEALVGVPLWAIAHLRYDGPGFPTNQSLFGYFVLIDIFIRPILIIFGLIASSVIFYAVVKTLNNIFDIVVSNLSGFDNTNIAVVPALDTGSKGYKRGPVDQMAFTIIYVITVYMIGTSCFKMIDLFPNSILRWMNANAQGFASRGEYGGNESGEIIGGKLKSGASRIGNSVGQTMGGFGAGGSDAP